MVEALRLSNFELKDFSHVASHDLQEPLRKIITFAERLIATGKNLSLSRTGTTLQECSRLQAGCDP